MAEGKKQENTRPLEVSPEAQAYGAFLDTLKGRGVDVTPEMTRPVKEGIRAMASVRQKKDEEVRVSDEKAASKKIAEIKEQFEGKPELMSALVRLNGEISRLEVFLMKKKKEEGFLSKIGNFLKGEIGESERNVQELILILQREQNLIYYLLDPSGYQKTENKKDLTLRIDQEAFNFIDKNGAADRHWELSYGSTSDIQLRSEDGGVITLGTYNDLPQNICMTRANDVERFGRESLGRYTNLSRERTVDAIKEIFGEQFFGIDEVERALGIELTDDMREEARQLLGRKLADPRIRKFLASHQDKKWGGFSIMLVVGKMNGDDITLQALLARGGSTWSLAVNDDFKAKNPWFTQPLIRQKGMHMQWVMTNKETPVKAGEILKDDTPLNAFARKMKKIGFLGFSLRTPVETVYYSLLLANGREKNQNVDAAEGHAVYLEAGGYRNFEIFIDKHGNNTTVTIDDTTDDFFKSSRRVYFDESIIF